jgi:hypothetical protein
VETSAETSWRPSLGDGFSEALSHFGPEGKAFSRSRSSRSASAAISGGPTTKAAQAALSIHAGNALVEPSSNWTKATSP